MAWRAGLWPAGRLLHTPVQDQWWKSRWFKSKICSMLFVAFIPVKYEVIVTVVMIAFSIFMRFWCTPTLIKSKLSSNFALRHGPPKLVYKTCAHKRRGSYPMFERLIDVCSKGYRIPLPECTQARNWSASPENFSHTPPWKMSWTYCKTIGHSLKHLSSSQKTLRPPGVPSWLWACIHNNERRKGRGRRGPSKNLTFPIKFLAKSFFS